MRNRQRLSLVSLVLATLVVASAAYAQTPTSQRPYRGLFRSGADEPAQSLNVEGSIGGGWDSSMVAEFGPNDIPNDGLRLRGAGYNSLSGRIGYDNTRDRVTLGISHATDARYYPSLADPILASHSTRVTVNYKVTRRTTLSLDQSVSYQPFGSLNLFPNAQRSGFQQADVIIPAATAPDLDTRAVNVDYTSFNTVAGASQQLSARGSFSASYGYALSRYGGDRADFTSHSAFGRYTYSLTQNLGLRLGYGYSEGRFADGDQQFHNHTIDSGFDYNRVLSISRRTTLGFDSGAAVVKRGAETRYDVIGGAQVIHEVGRSWLAGGAYRRNVQFIETLNQPFFTDAITVVVQGLPARRIEVNTSAGVAKGNLDFTAEEDRLTSYFGSATIGVAISRHLNVSTAYNYYRYSARGDAYRDLGFSDGLNRHSISVYLSAWAPLYQKGRRTNASR
ncbi:MAG: hypothetical protein ABL986_05790 [Vicinamibacterales bacterium]